MSLKKNSVPLFKKPTYRVAELVSSTPHEAYHLRQLQRKTGLSTTAVARAVDELRTIGFLIVEKTQLATNIRANLESDEYRGHRRLLNLYRIQRHGLIRKVVELFRLPEAVVLFGSFCRGEDAEQSDIDLLVISPQRPETSALEAEFERKVGRKLHILVLSSLEESEPEFRNAAANGIVLYGYLKVV